MEKFGKSLASNFWLFRMHSATADRVYSAVQSLHPEAVLQGLSANGRGGCCRCIASVRWNRISGGRFFHPFIRRLAGRRPPALPWLKASKTNSNSISRRIHFQKWVDN